VASLHLPAPVEDFYRAFYFHYCVIYARRCHAGLITTLAVAGGCGPVSWLCVIHICPSNPVGCPCFLLLPSGLFTFIIDLVFYLTVSGGRFVPTPFLWPPCYLPFSTVNGAFATPYGCGTVYCARYVPSRLATGYAGRHWSLLQLPATWCRYHVPRTSSGPFTVQQTPVYHSAFYFLLQLPSCLIACCRRVAGCCYIPVAAVLLLFVPSRVALFGGIIALCSWRPLMRTAWTGRWATLTVRACRITAWWFGCVRRSSIVFMDFPSVHSATFRVSPADMNIERFFRTADGSGGAFARTLLCRVRLSRCGYLDWPGHGFKLPFSCWCWVGSGDKPVHDARHPLRLLDVRICVIAALLAGPDLFVRCYAEHYHYD